MTRQEKYPETETFHFHNANPKHRLTTDCVVRAITLGTGIEYKEIVKALAYSQIETGYSSDDPKGFGRFLEGLGWTKHKQPRKPDGTKYTGAEFCRKLQREHDYRKIIANIGGGHTVCISYGQVCDTWDSTDGCIGNYWIKED